MVQCMCILNLSSLRSVSSEIWSDEQSHSRIHENFTAWQWIL